jgi:hypothetical protein
LSQLRGLKVAVREGVTVGVRVALEVGVPAAEGVEGAVLRTERVKVGKEVALDEEEAAGEKEAWRL